MINKNIQCDSNLRCMPAKLKSCFVHQDIDECSVNGGQGPCPQVCTNTPGAYNCSCYPCQNGLCINTSCWCVATYTGGNCSKPGKVLDYIFMSTSIVTSFDHEVFSGCELNPCLNGGVCIMTGQNSSCVCPANTTGLYCENCTLNKVQFINIVIYVSKTFRTSQVCEAAQLVMPLQRGY